MTLLFIPPDAAIGVDLPFVYGENPPLDTGAWYGLGLRAEANFGSFFGWGTASDGSVRAGGGMALPSASVWRNGHEGLLQFWYLHGS